MKKAKGEDTAASFSRWQDSHSRPPQSPWLQATLSDLDEKTEVMVSIIDQDDGDSFARRAEMFYRRRSELVGTIHDLHGSYGSLARRYKQLPSPGLSVENGSSSSSSSSSVTVNGSSRLGYELKPSAEKKLKVQGAETWRNDEVGLRLRVLKLTEDNLYQQAELIRTNNHNGEAIRHFCTRVNRLVDEHRDLKTFLRSHAPDAQ